MSSDSTGGSPAKGDATDPRDAANEQDEESVRVTDKRRIDPTTGEVREPVAAPNAEAAAVDDATVGELSDDARVLELTADLQRITAEYANYRKRVDRDREAIGEIAVISVLAELLPVLDDIERARSHDELEGAFKSVGEALEALVTKLGLETYGVAGDPFDPEIHEALTHAEGEGLDQPTCTEVYQPGYKFKDRVVRPARVAVSE